MNYSSHTLTHTHIHTSSRAHTQLLSATEGSATSLYFIIISLGIFLGCKGIPGGARPLKLSTPPPSSLLFPLPCTLSVSLSPCHPLSAYFNFFSVVHLFYTVCPLFGSPWAGCITDLCSVKKTKRASKLSKRAEKNSVSAGILAALRVCCLNWLCKVA